LVLTHLLKPLYTNIVNKAINIKPPSNTQETKMSGAQPMAPRETNPKKQIFILTQINYGLL